MVDRLGVAELRAELKHFAESSIRHELESLKHTILEDIRAVLACGDALKEVATEAPAQGPVKLVPEAIHGMQNGGTSRTLDVYTSPAEMGRAGVQLRQSGSECMTVETDDDSSGSEKLWSQESSREAAAQRPYEQMDALGKMQHAAATLLNWSHFETICGLAVVLNAAWVGLETDWQARNWTLTTTPLLNIINTIFVVIMVLELSVRMTAGGHGFFYDHNWRWNWFDFIATLLQVVDLSMCLSGLGKSNSAVRAVRTIKLVRVLRIARIATVFPELHVLISSVMDSLYSLFWVLILILSFLFAVSVSITDLVNDYKIPLGKEEMEKEHGQEILLEYYGSMDRTMLSFYMTITEGIHWGELVEPLAEYISPWTHLIFVIFVGFQLFALMNVITACFVDNAMKIAAKVETKEIVSSLWEMLAEVHADGNITQQGFRQCFEHPSMVRYLDIVGCTSDDPGLVFNLIDENGDGELTEKEFVHMCQKLIGNSSAIQLARSTTELKYEIRTQLQAIRAELLPKRSPR